MKNSCYTYFSIRGHFDPEEITAALGLVPYDTHKIGEARRGGKTFYDTAAWYFGRCDGYEPEAERQMMTTIRPLLEKVEILKAIRQIYAVTYTLEVVPTVHSGEITPCLAPSLEVMRFCCETETLLDIDLYVI